MIVRHVALPPEAAPVRTMLQTNDPDQGTLVVQARPDIRRASTLVHDLLAAMGKRSDVMGISRSASDDLRYLEVWLAAHRIREVALVETNWIRPGVLDGLLAILRRADVDVLLADRLPTSEHHDGVLQNLRSVSASPDQLPAGVATSSVAVTRFPQVPDDDFVTFLWTCRELLPPNHAKVVEERYEAAFQCSASVRRRQVGDAVAAGVLRPMWAEVRSGDEAVTIVRAFQAATFRGTRVSVNLDRLRRAGELAGALRCQSTWHRLRAYRQPYRGALIALLAMDLGVDEARRIPVGAADPSGGSVVVAGQRRPAPSGAEIFLRAMRLEREQDGAGLGEPLLARLGGPISNQSLARAVSEAALDVGVRAVEGRVERRIDDRAWLRQRGIRVQEAA